jgi:predicted nucleic acid-binding protein
MVVFDSTVIIDALRQKKPVLDLIDSYSRDEKIAITTITKYEILRGAKEKNLNLITEMLAKFLVHDLDDSAIAEAIKIYKKLKEKGRLINELDVLIVGIVAANDETLITKDKDFLNFKNQKITVL